MFRSSSLRPRGLALRRAPGLKEVGRISLAARPLGRRLVMRLIQLPPLQSDLFLRQQPVPKMPGQVPVSQGQRLHS
jgi:hypothetical protein